MCTPRYAHLSYLYGHNAKLHLTNENDIMGGARDRLPVTDLTLDECGSGHVPVERSGVNSV